MAGINQNIIISSKTQDVKMPEEKSQSVKISSKSQNIIMSEED